ncbi:MAG TPA: formimidoylglutamate deiminase [Candidatus Acidoferrales bacterium]|nr:formimidoylglutamate deiminase [Candidatus Acidoferrales bacterium]
MSARYIADLALLPSGWSRDVRIDVDGDGSIERIDPESTGDGATRLAGALVPGMPNVHSHAFQRALAGRLERPASARDNFWTWREGMYDLASRVTPDDVESIAEYVYVQMLEAGYTSVGEFHYIHHDPNGTPYASRTEMSERIVQAARSAGIELTLLLVLYRHAGFGGEALLPSQRRFETSVDELIAMFEALRKSARTGVAPHSLRAVTQHELRELLGAIVKYGDTPIHIHIAEQRREVEDCVRRYGSNPIAWLLSNVPVNSAWTLVHATHLEPNETRTLAQSGAVAGLCPTTEANLGDGIFPAEDFLRAGGSIAIGSDSHVTVDPSEELRLLEYGQRLVHQGRTLLDRVYTRASRGGAQSLGIAAGAIEAGKRADLVALDLENVAFAACPPELILDAWVFGGGRDLVKDVLVGGKHLVREGRHVRAEEAKRRYSDTMQRLFSRS